MISKSFIFAAVIIFMSYKKQIVFLFLALSMTFLCHAQGNWVRTIEPLNGSTSKPMNDYTMSRISVAHFDGLGRAKSSIKVAAGSGEYDIADYLTYDSLGRASKQWLPVRTQYCGGDYPSSFENVAQSFHGDNYPYSEITYDGSHYNRVYIEQGPGQNWRQNEASLRHYYILNDFEGVGWELPNDLAFCDLGCPYFYVDDSGNLRRDYEYSPGKLKVEITLDEDNHCTAVFTDKQGRKVLQRQSDWNTQSDTYWVYDIYGRLRYVISPEGSRILKTHYQGLCDVDAIERYCYVYGYDNQDRCIIKKMPGQAEQHIVYDKLGRVIFSQDGEQRMKNEWSVRKYDNQQRIAVEGRAVMANATRESLQQQWGNTTIIEVYNPNLEYEGDLLYSNNCGISNFTADKAYYYDDYSHWGTIMPMPVDASFPRGDIYSAKGLLTGYATTDFNGDVYVAINTYDRKGDVVMTSERDIYGQDYMVTTFMAYDHVGNLTDKKRLTQQLAEQQVMESYNEQWEYSYDAWGRNTQVRHRYGSNNWRILGMFFYDQLGRKSDCYFGNSNSNHITYNYNLRGWLTNINGRYYSQTLYYNSNALGQGQFPLYNGNISGISEISYNSNGAPIGMTRKINYDELGRLTSVVADFPKYNEYYSYDLNGNVKRIVRGGNNDYMYRFDKLSVSYSGNQMQSVTDSAYFDFFMGDVAQVVTGDYPDAFDYDLDGRLIRDDCHGITQVVYNPLGLPSVINLDADHDIHITYHSDGSKRQELMREFYIASVMRIDRVTGDTTWVDQRKVRTVRREFLGDMILETGKPPRIYNEFGYIDIHNNGDSVSYHFYERDHLGSVMAVVNENGTKEMEMGYFASGIPVRESLNIVDDRLHTSKQWMAFGGLSWYDNLARMYDPIFMRFTTPDLMQEKYPHLSPYAFCANSPFNLIDPSGMVIAYHENGRKYTYKMMNGEDWGFYDQYNEMYKGNSEFLHQLEAALAKLREGFYGSFLVCYLAASKEYIQVKDARTTQKADGNESNNNHTSGMKVYWDADNTKGGGMDISGKTTRPAYIGLAHEFGHVLDNIIGITNESFHNHIWYSQRDLDGNIKNISQSEKYACAWENAIREEHSIPLRKYYSSYYGQSKGILLDKTNRPKYYYNLFLILKKPFLLKNK